MNGPDPATPSPGACAVCASRATTSDVSLQEPAFAVVRCRECGFGWTHPPVPDAEIGEWYPQSYYGERNVRFNFVLEALVRVFRRRRSDVIARLTRPGPVLDVGCGRGFMLNALRRRGYEARGVELSAHAARHARETLGLDVHVGDFFAAPHAAGTFHAVIFWHSLEHFRNPLAAIARARELLVPGGLLVVAVPNSDSLQASLFGMAWFHLDVPRHYVHFGLRSLRRSLEEAGFRLRVVSHFSLEQNPYGALQSLYNALGFEFNLLYSLIKTKSAHGHRVRSHALQAAVVLLLLPFFLPIAFAIWAIEVVARRGGTIDVYAEKT